LGHDRFLAQFPGLAASHFSSRRPLRFPPESEVPGKRHRVQRNRHTGQTRTTYENQTDQTRWQLSVER
jgi:hypothetical protein